MEELFCPLWLRGFFKGCLRGSSDARSILKPSREYSESIGMAAQCWPTAAKPTDSSCRSTSLTTTRFSWSGVVTCRAL